MNSVIDQTELVARVVTCPSEIERLRWFQTLRYVESGLLQTRPVHLPDDPLVAASCYFAVYAGDDIKATARIVRSPELSLLKHHQIYPAVQQRLDAEAGSIGEIGRLAVAPKTPNLRALALLCREFMRYGVRHQNAVTLVASIGQPLIRIVNRVLGVPLDVIGPAIDQFGDFHEETLPVMIDTVECLSKLLQNDSPRWEFYSEGLVIDLTEEVGVSYQTDDLALAAI